MKYETPTDLVAEEEIAKAVVAAKGLLAAPKLPLCYVLDRAALREAGITCFFEIKDRKRSFGKGDGLYLSLYKVMRGYEITAATGIPCRLVARFKGGEIHWCSLADYDRQRGVFWFGRNDRPGEEEPVVAFPWEVFHPVKRA